MRRATPPGLGGSRGGGLCGLVSLAAKSGGVHVLVGPLSILLDVPGLEFGHLCACPGPNCCRQDLVSVEAMQLSGCPEPLYFLSGPFGSGGSMTGFCLRRRCGLGFLSRGEGC